MLVAATDQPLRVAVAPPQLLDLRQADVSSLIPKDGRNPSLVEATSQAWQPLTTPLAQAASVRLLLPSGPMRLPMLLAASQAIKSRFPACRLYVAFDPKGGAILEDLAWGAVEGGALVAEDLGPDPEHWRDRLVQAQEQFPGRPWTLWVPLDPGPRTAMLMGDGGRLVVPEGGSAARLAQKLPPAFGEVEGGLGDLTLTQRKTGESRRWKFQEGEWMPAERFKDRHEVAVSDREAYDVSALLARMRATQTRDKAAIRTTQARMDYTMHLQGDRGNTDLAFIFQAFEKAGEPEEALRKQVLYNGVNAKLHGDAQLPIVEARSSLAAPVAFSLTERYRYSDGGPGGPGQRLIRFEPVDEAPLLSKGELVVQEATGRILEERSHRSGLPGIVRSEARVLSYGEPGPGLWRVVKTHSTERWMIGGDTTQVIRTVEYKDFVINAEDFDAKRDAARASDGSMIQQTLDGARYYTKQKDGTRKAEEHATSGGKAAAGVLVVDPSSSFPVLPLAGMLFYDLNALNRGIQYSFLTAIVFNDINVTIPNLVAGVDFHSSAVLSLMSDTDRPVVNGQLQDRDGVQRRSQTLQMDLSRDLGAGFRFALTGNFTLDQFSDPQDSAYKTQGFINPASGLNSFTSGQLSWQRAGLVTRAFYGLGHRPECTWGEPGALQLTPDQGRYRRWGGSAAYDVELGGGVWLQPSLGAVSGKGFDRFQAIDFDGMVSGIRSHALVADQLSYGSIRLTVPTGPNLRMGFGLDHGVARSMDDRKTYGFTGLAVSGDLPGFWWFTAVKIEMGIGLQSDIGGVRTVNGMVTFIRLL